VTTGITFVLDVATAPVNAMKSSLFLTTFLGFVRTDHETPAAVSAEILILDIVILRTIAPTRVTRVVCRFSIQVGERMRHVVCHKL